MSFSENLKKIRMEKNLSQEQLAEMTGVSRQAVSKWEQGNGYPETEKLINIAKTLDVSLDTLLLDKLCVKETKEQNQPFYTGERRITIRSGETMSSYYKFSIQKNYFPGKNGPKYALCGTDKSGFFGDNLDSLGWYASQEDAQKELSEIYKAILDGESVYEIKYHAKVKVKAFGVFLDNEE
ncbi:MAG: helix-turn-helix domain-containing protein [Oscillospiraceae bacterium]|nr:helix-turn-helix domain-containing protein [Oscillospiraceae bacterium]